MASAAFSSMRAFSVPSFFLVAATRVSSRFAEAWRISSRFACTAKSDIIWLRWSLYSETVVSWLMKVSGSSDSISWLVEESAWPWYCATTEEATSWRIEATLVALPAQVGVQRLELRRRLLQLEPGVVVPLGGLLGLVVEVVDAALHGVDVGRCVGGGCDEHRAADRSDAQRRERTGSSFPAVVHERTVSSLSQRLPS